MTIETCQCTLKQNNAHSVYFVAFGEKEKALFIRLILEIMNTLPSYCAKPKMGKPYDSQQIWRCGVTCKESIFLQTILKSKNLSAYTQTQRYRNCVFLHPIYHNMAINIFIWYENQFWMQYMLLSKKKEMWVSHIKPGCVCANISF